MGSAVGGLLGGKPKSASQSTTVQVPKWLDAQNQSLVNRAVAASNTPYEAYTGERVAPLTQDTQSAMQLTRDNTGKYQGLLDQSSNLASMYGQRAASGPSATDIQNNMNPYIQNVLDIARRKIGEQSGQQLVNQRGAAAKSNAFGGSRNAIKESELFKNTSQLMSDTQAQGMSSAFDQAMAQWNQQNKDILGASQNLGATATTNQGVNTNDIGNLLKSGEIERLVNQAGLDTDYESWDKEQAYQYDNLNFLANILNPQTSYYSGQQTTGTQSNGGGSTLGNALGTASSIASIVGMFSDENLKKDAKQVGELDNGTPVYSFKYKGDDRTQIGLMSKDVKENTPEAVSKMLGYDVVDYSKATQTDRKEYATGGGVTAQEKAKQLMQAPSKGQVGTPLSFSEDQESSGGDMGGLANMLSSIVGNGGLGSQVTDFGGGENIIWNTDRAGKAYGASPNITDFGGGEQILWDNGGGMWDQVSNGFSNLFSGFKGFADGGRVNREDGPERLVSPSEEQAFQIAELLKSIPPLEQTESGALFETAPAPEVLLDQAPDMKTTDDAGFLDKIINNLNQSKISSGPNAGPMMGKALETGRDAFSNFMSGFSGGGEQVAATQPSGVQDSAKLFSNAKAAQRNAAAVNAPAAPLDEMLARAGAPADSGFISDAQAAEMEATQPATEGDPLMDILKRKLLTREVSAKEPTLSEILGAFGKGMLNTNGEERDFFQQLGMGQTSVDTLKADKKKGAAEEEQDLLASITDFLKTKAYIEQVAKQGDITEYQKIQAEQEALNEIGRNLRATMESKKPGLEETLAKILANQ